MADADSFTPTTLKSLTAASGTAWINPAAKATEAAKALRGFAARWPRYRSG